jgi:hypothetical protein
MSMRVSLALLTVLLAGGVACAHAPQPGRLDPARAAKMDARLASIAASAADTVVGVFIRTTRPLDAADRQALERAGVRVGTVTGELLTGEVAGGSLAAVAGLPFVRHMELSRSARPQGRSRARASITSAPDGGA